MSRCEGFFVVPTQSVCVIQNMKNCFWLTSETRKLSRNNEKDFAFLRFPDTSSLRKHHSQLNDIFLISSLEGILLQKSWDGSKAIKGFPTLSQMERIAMELKHFWSSLHFIFFTLPSRFLWVRAGKLRYNRFPENRYAFFCAMKVTLRYTEILWLLWITLTTRKKVPLCIPCCLKIPFNAHDVSLCMWIVSKIQNKHIFSRQPSNGEHIKIFVNREPGTWDVLCFVIPGLISPYATISRDKKKSSDHESKNEIRGARETHLIYSVPS